MTKWTLQRHIAHINKELHKRGLNNLTSIQTKRIKGHLLISCITNEWFTLLRNKKEQAHEKQAALFIGAFTPLVDDLMDEEGYSGAQILSICRGQSKLSNSTEFAVRYCYQQLMNLVTNKKQFIRLSEIIIGEAQEESRKQTEGNTGLKELFRITRNKGGYATLYFRAILDNEITEEEKKAILNLGEALQLENDAFDIYKDTQEGQVTPALKMSDFNAYGEIYEDKLKEIVSDFKKINYPSKHIKRSLISIMLILSRGIVCINQHKALQGNADKLSITSCKRDILICDMDTPTNFYKSIKLTINMTY